MAGTRSLRRTSQFAFLAVTLLGLVGIGTTGILYPYFFCYSCPWDVGACPIGIMEHGFVEIQITFMTGLSLLLYLLGFFMLIGLFFGRGFCGWACPIGALQDMTKKLRISDRVRKRLNVTIDPRVKYIKYLILLLIPVTSYITRDLFYTQLCPVGGVTGTLPTLTFYSSEWLFASGFPAKITSIILFGILIVLVTRGWCKYLCPIGAFLAPFNKVSILRLERNEKSCKSCSVCDTKCPMDIVDPGTKDDPECILCGRCTTGCNFASLKLGFMGFDSKKAMATWLVLLLAGSAIIGAGFITGGYERTDEINAIPCIGCLALNPNVTAEWRNTTRAQPNFILDYLDTEPVFIHYRTDVCPGCDEMEPHIALLEQQYDDRVHFIHINLDHATAAEDASYDVYDFAGTPDSRFGVPMFTTVIVVMNGSEPQIMYNTQYGSSADQGESRRLVLENTLVDALDRHIVMNSVTPPVTPGAQTELFLNVDNNHLGALPNGSAEFSLSLYNAMNESIQVNLSLEKPANWDAVLSRTTLTLPADTSATFTLNVTGNTTLNGQIGEFSIHAWNFNDPVTNATVVLDVQVRDELLPPRIINTSYEPILPYADQPINITVTVDDNSQVSQVNLSYFSCTPLTCSPYFLVPMNTTDGNTFTTSVYPVAPDHNSFHYKIIATDVYGNVNETAFHDVELIPVEDTGHHTPTGDISSKPKWMGVVLLLSFAGAAIVLVAVSMRRSGKAGKEDEHPQSDEIPEPEEIPATNNIAARARIQKAYDDGKITEAQYRNNMERFKD